MNSAKKLTRLHLGAFDQPIEGWVNTDITPHIFVTRFPMLPWLMKIFKLIDENRYQQHKAGVFRKLKYMNLTKTLPVGTETVEAIFSSHVFEHLFPDEIFHLVNEIKRVLIPGGICRVVVPDLKKIVNNFDPEDPSEFLKRIFENSTRSGIKNQHHTGFTEESLGKLFTETGFSKTTASSYMEGACPDINRLDNRPDESIFFEATK